MRKILMVVLVILVIILAYFTIFEGIAIGSFEILSTNGIVSLSDRLDTEINTANRMIKSDYQTRQGELSSAVDTLLSNKEQYYNLANVSTDSEITEANTEEYYYIEFLFLRIGRHARDEGVNFRMDIKAGNMGDSVTKNITFTVDGQYPAIIGFVSELENDSDLAFRIENFHMLPNGENVQATFDVNGVRIMLEETTSGTDTNAETSSGTTTGTTTGVIGNTAETSSVPVGTDTATVTEPIE